MPRPKGLPKTGGRVAGKTPAIITMRESVWEAFGLLGGIGNLVRWAKANETEFYKLAGKLMPVAEKEHSDVNILINVGDAKEVLLQRLAHRISDPDSTGIPPGGTVQ